MSRDHKRPGRALGFGLPDLETEPDAASVEQRLRLIENKIDELLARSEKNKRGRPRDAYADAFKEVSEAMEPVLRQAFEHVWKEMPLGTQVAISTVVIDIPGFVDLVIKEVGRRLPVALKGASTWHYQRQRKVKDPVRASRSGNRRRRDKTDPAD